MVCHSQALFIKIFVKEQTLDGPLKDLHQKHYPKKMKFQEATSVQR